MIDPQEPASHGLHRLRESFEDLNRYTRLTILFLLVPTAIVTLIAIILVIYALVSKSNLADSLLTVLASIIAIMGVAIGASQAFLLRKNKDN